MLNANILVLQLLHGLAFGMTLLLLSLGLSLIFGIAGVVNFAHGAMYAAGAYIAFTVYQQFGNAILGVVVAMVAMALLGGATEVSIIRPLYDRDHLFQLLATFGLVFIFDGTIVNVYGTVPKRMPVPTLFQGPIQFEGIFYPKYRIVLIVVSALLTAGIWFLLSTDYGVRIRAATYDSEMVDALGTDTKRLFTGTFMLGAGLAALAGGLAAPVFTVYPNMGENMIILVFIVVVVGGLGSFSGAIVGSLLIGEALMLGQVFLGGYANLMPYIAMLIVLIARPRGLFGQEVEL